MKILKIILLINFFFLNSSFSFSQNHIEINSEKEFQTYFHVAMLKYNDTLQNALKRRDILYVRFNISEKGFLDSILFSVKQPVIIIDVLKNVLSQVKMNMKGIENNETYYILPVNYDYSPEPNPNGDINDLFGRIEKIDVSNWQSYLNFDNNGLFKVEENNKGLWGIKCVFLPPIKITCHNTFTNSNRTFH